MSSLSLSHSSCLCSLHTTTNSIKPTLFHLHTYHFKPPKFTPFALTSNSSNNPEGEQSLEESLKSDRVQIALQRAKEYKKSSKEGFEDVRVSMENKGIVGIDKNIDQYEILEEEGGGGEQVIPEAVRRAMEKAKEYQKNKGVVDNDESNVGSDNQPGDVRGGNMEVPEAVRVAIEKAKENKENKDTIDNNSSKLSGSTRSEGGNGSNLGSESIEQDTEKKGDLKLSSIDFVGLNFSDKKSSRGLPAGLVPVSDPYSDDALPEVEILVGDTSKFGDSTSSESKESSQEENSDLYKPKVSTWGMFPRPNNISKTFGGGRNIRPGEELEAPEDRAVKEARTKQLIAAYKRKIGLNMDPKLKAECEKSFRH